MLENLIYFVQYCMAPIILALGFVGNILGFTVLTRKRIHRIGPRSMYKYLFAADTFYLLLIVVNYLAYAFSYDLTISSKYFCKLYWYFNFVLGPISPLMLCYISVEKLISIKSPSRKFFMRRSDVQGFFVAITVAFNALLYLPVTYDFHITSLNETVLCEGKPFNQFMNKISNLEVLKPSILLAHCFYLIIFV